MNYQISTTEFEDNKKNLMIHSIFKSFQSLLGKII